MSIDNNYSKPVVYYRGPNAGEKFLKCMLKEQDYIQRTLKNRANTFKNIPWLSESTMPFGWLL